MRKKKPAEKKSVAKKKTGEESSGSVPVEIPFSLQSMERLLAGIGGMMGQGQRSAENEAQEIMYDAWEAPTRQRAIALAKKALEVSPDCADAYSLLAEETAKSLEEAIELYRKGVEAGERALGKKVFEEDVGYFWGILETRPYMRARAGLAQSLWEAGRREEATEHYRDLLRLNPNDNQGIRHLLMPRLIELDHDEDAEKLFRQYEEDGMAVWLYSRVLLDFRKHGDGPVATTSLKAALEGNGHVPAYLLGRRKMPRILPDYYGYGDDNEAVLYVHENKAAWKTTPSALEWLAAKMT